MRAIVVDDEYLALESMSRMLQRHNVTVAGAFQDPREALKHANDLEADVAFLDIEMPELNGLELASRLQSANPGLQIVFVTAYEQYAIEAFELAAVDYLLKPLQLKRLDLTLKRLQVKVPEPEVAEAAPTQVLGFFHHFHFQDAVANPLSIPWRTMKAKELLAYLIHSGDKTPSKEELLDRIWPDMDLEKSVTHLHTSVYHIRQTLKNAGIPLAIQYKEGRYRVESSNLPVDVTLWEKALREAAEEDDQATLSRLLLHGYKGDYLESEGFLWAENERERLRTLWLEHALRSAGRMESSGMYSDAISLFQQLQQRFPESESSYFGLMRLYDKLGNATEVHHQYAKLKEMLDEEFGILPGAPIVEWFEDWNARKTG